MTEIHDKSGANIGEQIFDLSQIDSSKFPKELTSDITIKDADKVIIVMDYAFGEQAYEYMDELLKPYEQ